ncbi:low-density lipoprotein receptor-related protein 2-like [Hydractinia symbiolongicarpus]|uniref:low-density lipoprotein receptor-related protein 2-like n=1 Tax=Hydractinia symbiolongicarpus TaxID=13093 RepID=UPI002551872F|nr:low-density lipoprotein receptor-related protein 2-like [Hydractinia symbiolongicarpus]
MQITAVAFEKASNTIYYAQSNGKVKAVKDVYGKRPNKMIFNVKKPTALDIESCFGYLFIADSGSRSIIRYDTRHNISFTVVDGLSLPNALTVDKLTEKLFWADTTTDSYVYKYNF